jgi:hypothetical protein
MTISMRSLRCQSNRENNLARSLHSLSVIFQSYTHKYTHKLNCRGFSLGQEGGGGAVYEGTPARMRLFPSDTRGLNLAFSSLTSPI